MQLQINGETKDFPQPQTVLDLLASLGMKDKPVAVEVNKRLVPRKLHETTALSDGDVIEIVTFVGGG